MAEILVSIVMATLNEEEYIERCMSSLLAQQNVPGEYEVLVFDGGSEDRTLAILQDIAKRDHRVRLLKNPARIQVCAFNMGLKEARGEYIAVVGAHAEYDVDYISACLGVLEATGATNVGGLKTPVGEGCVGQAIAWAISSPLGKGPSRQVRHEEFAHNVFGFFGRKSALEAVGGFDEKYVTDEDTELNYRIRQAGGKVIVSPKIHFKYYVRKSLRAFWRQAFGYGFGEAQTHHNCAGSLRIGQMPRPLLIVGTSVSLAWLAIRPSWPALIVPLAYLLFALAGGLVALWDTRSLKVAILAPLALAALHFPGGLGWWFGVRRFGLPNLSPSGTGRGRVHKEA